MSAAMSQLFKHPARDVLIQIGPGTPMQKQTGSAAVYSGNLRAPDGASACSTGGSVSRSGTQAAEAERLNPGCARPVMIGQHS